MHQKPLIARVATATLCAALLAFPVCGPATAAADDAASNEPLDALFEQGRRALIDQDYAKAIRIYSHLLEYPAARQNALEYLGLARERNGQLASGQPDCTENGTLTVGDIACVISFRSVTPPNSDCAI